MFYEGALGAVKYMQLILKGTVTHFMETPLKPLVTCIINKMTLAYGAINVTN